MVARLMETQILWLSASGRWLWGGLDKKQWLLLHFHCCCCWRHLCHLALVLKSVNSILYCMALVPFNLMPQQWSSEQVSLSASKSMCRPFKRITWLSNSPLSHSDTISADFRSQKLSEIFFLALKSWFWEIGVRLGTLVSQGGPPQLMYYSQYLTIMHGWRANPFYLPTLPTSLCDFCIYLDIEFLSS